MADCETEQVLGLDDLDCLGHDIDSCSRRKVRAEIEQAGDRYLYWARYVADCAIIQNVLHFSPGENY